MKTMIWLTVIFGFVLATWSASWADMEQVMAILTSDIIEEFGHTVANAGDVNGDGYEDLVIGTGADVSPSFVYLFFGGPIYDTIPDVTLRSESKYFGQVLSGAGDVNGDGYSDIMIYRSDNGHFVHLYFGGNPMDTLCDVTLSGERWFGQTMTYAGDLNADGYDDAVVGAYGAQGGGKVYIFFGGNPMNSIPDLILQSDILGFGLGLRGVSDVNGDGYVDLGVGNPWKSSNRGEVFIYFGGPEGDGKPDVHLRGIDTYSHFGYDLAGCDLNSDGYSDIIVGAPHLSGGQIYVYRGGPSISQSPDLSMKGRLGEDQIGRRVLAVGDLNHDGYNDFVSQTYQPKGRLFACYGNKWMDRDFDLVIDDVSPYFGLTFAGIDFNGDGRQDLAAGSREENVVYIFRIRTKQFTISLVPDTRTVVKGEELGFNATITNNTNKVQTLYFYVQILGPDAYPIDKVPALGPKLKKIGTKKTVTKHVSIDMPGDLQVGQYTCTVKADTTEPEWPYYDFIENDSFEFEIVLSNMKEHPLLRRLKFIPQAINGSSR